CGQDPVSVSAWRRRRTPMPRGTVLMKCPRCQHENPVQAKFCLECGARLSSVCAKCQTQLPAGAKFCLECGVGGALEVMLPALFALLDAQGDDPQWRTFDVSQRRELMLDAVKAPCARSTSAAAPRHI